jgi:hypothetical protein
LNQAHLDITDMEDIPVLDYCVLIDTLMVHIGPVSALEVHDMQGIALELDTRVPPGDGGLVKGQGGIVVPSDNEGKMKERVTLERVVILGIAFEVP